MSVSKCLPVWLLAVVMAACSAPANRNSGNANSAASANNGATSAGGTVSAAATEALTKAISAQLSAHSYRARVDATLNGEETARTIEYVAPDRFHITSEADETLIIGDTVWARPKDGKWQKQPMNANAMLAAVRDPRIVDEIRKNAVVALVGPDTLDAKPMTVYEYTLRNVMGTPMTSRAKAWIAVADSLPHRIESETEFNGQTSKSTVTYFDYNTDIKIEPPK
jgi:hypothetical protein